jgi:hypothetical protein
VQAQPITPDKSLIAILNHVSAVCALLGFVWAIIAAKRAGTNFDLAKALGKAFAAGAIPTGILLVCSAFSAELLAYIGDLHLHIVAAGLALLYVSYRGLLE